MNVWNIFQSGGPVMWPLLLCSILVITVIFERILFWIALERTRDRPLMDEILSIAERGDWALMQQKCGGCKDYVIRVLAVGILHRTFSMEKAMEAEAEATIQRMRRFMPILDTMITVAPLLGILGTVLGIIASFKMLAGGSIADPQLVTGGIAQALITTATGLTISIIAVIPYNMFNSRIEHAIHIMEKYASSLEVVYKKIAQDRLDEA